jgi:hypothetical protein
MHNQLFVLISLSAMKSFTRVPNVSHTSHSASCVTLGSRFSLFTFKFESPFHMQNFRF